MNRLRLDQLWTPDAEPTLLAWYDPTDADTITESGGNVSQWDDKGPYGYHMIQTNGGIQPNWGVGAQINGLNVMHYSGTFDEMEVLGLPDINLTGVAGVTLLEGKTAGDWPAGGRLNKTDSDDRMLIRMQSNPTFGKSQHVVKIDGTSYATASGNESIYQEEVPMICSLYYDGASAIARGNGGVVVTTNSGTPDGATLTINEFQVGRDSNTPRNYQGDLIWLATGDLAIIQKAEGYIAHKWGTTSILDAGHPYKSVPPFI